MGGRGIELKTWERSATSICACSVDQMGIECERMCDTPWCDYQIAIRLSRNPCSTDDDSTNDPSNLYTEISVKIKTLYCSD